MWKYIASLSLFITLFLGLNLNDANASGNYPDFKHLITDSSQYIVYKHSSGNYQLLVSRDTSNKFYIMSDGTLTSTKQNTYMYNFVDGNWKKDIHSPTRYGVSKFVTYDFETNVNIYADDTFTSFFFSVPSPYVRVTERDMVTIPKTMGATLVDGGLLSTALIVLAILLGVLLVRRFPLWRLR